MNIKQSLKPNWKKIIVFGILFVIFDLLILFWALSITGGDFGYFNKIGLPLGFYRIPVCSNTPQQGVICGGGFFSLVYLIIDILFWYVMSCFIVWICNKLKKKPS